MGRVFQNNEIDRALWHKALDSQYASPFQTPEYFDTINTIDGYNAQAFAYVDNNHIKALAVLVLYKEKGIKSFFSRRAIVYGGPLICEATYEEYETLLLEIKRRLSGKAIYIEIRNYFDYSSFKDLYGKLKWEYLPYVNVQMDLQEVTKETLQKKFKYNRRREIKQSLENNATYCVTKDMAEAREIYNILEELYKERVKLPIPPFHFFEKQIEAGIIKVFAVKHDGKIIGGSYCPVLENGNIYTFYYCGIRNYHNKIFSTHLAVLAAMEYAIEKNIGHFDFMGAGLKDEKYGVRSYKKAFGGELVEHGRYVKILSPGLYKLGKIGLKILSKL
jgi:serine/alanine adding enzyme